MIRYIKIIFIIAICLAVGLMSSQITQANIPFWYENLQKPSFTPPNWVFAPVWTFLFATMGAAAGMVWNHWENRKEEVQNALIFFFVQLGLNAFWTYLFFGLKNLLLASVEIILLWLLIYETYLKFLKFNRWCGYLLIPYLLWVSYATLLTIVVWYLN